ncbi:E3 ubiquitin-protein ligase TRIM62-like [Bufo bufo]|uniref:E3 ubiquitin-protein ligase TRIM62-like n=1 Tax=Bufo bufo TaxID=8384 RepID=UPI001ABE9BA6|nr:E3 ubiquitin-protein ligase TRIM62-like [Bufo bufo]
MASADLREELKCSICLEIYRDPVNLSCCHNYCRSCIHRMLDTQEAFRAYKCPECRTTFLHRPVLQKNIALCNIVNIFSSANPEQSGSDIHCSYCIYSAVPAIQSCLHCEASLCSNHLRVHSRSAEHVLTEATRTPEKRKCPVHKEILKYHCIVDDVCICVTCCLAGEHYGHQVELLEVASEKKKDKLRTLLEKLSFKREKIEKKLQDLQERRYTEPGDEEATVLFPDMRGEMVLYTVSSLIQLFKIKKDKFSVKIQQLQELCNSSDSVSVVREKDVDLHDFFDGEGEDEEQEQYNHELHEEVGDQAVDQISKPQDCPKLVLDISTSANNILVSDDLKTMYWSAVYQNRPETPKRFQYNQILSSCFFSSGRHFWEVETSETGDWRLGVAYHTIQRNGDQSYFGDNDKSWCLRRLYKNQYSVMHDNMVTTCPHTFTCNRFRIFLDYEAGQLSFYELSSPIRHLHTVMATFTGPLHAAFGVGYWLSGEHCCLKVLHHDSFP